MNIDLDKEIKMKHVENYIESCSHEFEQLLRLQVDLISKNGLVTYRKIKRIKKAVLFIMLKNVVK